MPTDTEREKLVAALDAAAEYDRVHGERDHAIAVKARAAAAEWRRAYDALRDYDRTHPPAPTP